MEIFAVDLGNKQVKLKSSKEEKVLPSRFIYEDDMGLSLGNLLTKEVNVSSFKVPFDEETYIWGLDVDNLKNQQTIMDSLTFNNRYNTDAFKLLMNFSIGLLASQFEEAYKGIMEVEVTTGLPTDDYQNKSNIDSIIATITGQHQITIDGKIVTVRVKKVNIIPQPIGTLYNNLLNDEGHVANESLIDESVAIVDIGGGTLLIDVVKNFQLDTKNRVQTQLGINYLYDLILEKLEEKPTRYELEKIIRDGNPSEYIYSPSKNTVTPITKQVNRNIKKYTQSVVINNLQLTLKDISNIDTVLITGGGANIIDIETIQEVIPFAESVNNPEIANVRGFYKYTISKNSKNKSK